MPKLTKSLDERKLRIVQYIDTNPGTSERKVRQAMEDHHICSDRTTRKDIKELISRNIIRAEKKFSNSRSFQLYVSSDKRTTTILEESRLKRQRINVENWDRLEKQWKEDNERGRLANLKLLEVLEKHLNLVTQYNSSISKLDVVIPDISKVLRMDPEILTELQQGVTRLKQVFNSDDLFVTS